MALRTPTADAEDIKVSHGTAKQVLANADDMIEVPGIGERGPRMLSRQALAAVIEPRVEELFSLVQQVVRESGYEELLSSGVVVTGGTAMMDGMVELGEDIFLKPVRLGVPRLQREPVGRRAQPAFLDGDGVAAGSAAATTARSPHGVVARWRQGHLPADAGMVRG